MGVRVALYYAPATIDPLHTLGAAWLGRDPETGAAVRQPNLPNIEAVTNAPRHYGLHATLRPPMSLKVDYASFAAACSELAAQTRPFALPPLQAGCVGNFVALTLSAPCPPMRALADRSVRATEPCRAALSPDEFARRCQASLTPRQTHTLKQWGYPYLFEDWTFHITLTGPLPPNERDVWREAAAAHFAPALACPRLISELCVFTERDKAPMLIAERYPFDNLSFV